MVLCNTFRCIKTALKTLLVQLIFTIKFDKKTLDAIASRVMINSGFTQFTSVYGNDVLHGKI